MNMSARVPLAMSVLIGSHCGLASGAEWGPMTSGTTQILWDVWGTGPNDVFAVGLAGTILHYDGSVWSPMASGTDKTLRAVWGSGPNDVFVVGERGTILHYDGSTWRKTDMGWWWDLKALCGFAPNDVIAGGYHITEGAFLHFDGSTWTSMSFPQIGVLRCAGLWGSGPNDVFAVEEGTDIYHYDGSAWSKMSSGVLLGQLEDVFGFGPNDVFAVGGPDPYRGGVSPFMHYDGTSWSSMTNQISYPAYDVWGAAPNSVFAVGKQGMILHYDGTRWSYMTSPTKENLRGIWGSGPNDIFAVGYQGRILHYPGSPGFQLTIRNANPVWGDVVGPDDTSYAPGTLVTLKAIPGALPGTWRMYLYDPNYPGDMNYVTYGPANSFVGHFSHWEVDDANHPGDANYTTIDANSSVTIVMNGNRCVTAFFACGSGLGSSLPLLVVGLSLLGFGARRSMRAS